MRHAPKAFYALARKCAEGNFSRELSARFERYVLELLGDVPKTRGVFTEDQIAHCTQGKKCDVLVELIDAIALIECIAVMRTSRILIESVLRNDNSTRKIQRGIRQLCDTAQAVKTGMLNGLLQSPQKPLIGIVTILGDLPFPNSSWYYERVIGAELEESLGDALGGLRVLHARPIILTIEALELLVTALAHGGSLPDLVGERSRQPYGAVGDWATFLRKELEAKPPTQSPRWMTKLIDDFGAQFNVRPREWEKS